MESAPILDPRSQPWLARAAAHWALVAPHADAFVDRRSRGLQHPVHDFLFTYYSFAPAKLKQWVPAIGEVLACTDDLFETHPWLAKWGAVDAQRATYQLDETKLDARMISLARFVAELCTQVRDRPPRYRCYGLHEWAMVYRMTPEQVRHSGQTLRLSPSELGSFIESQSICCSHYDAFRFFTPEAVPLNTLKPRLDTRLQLEQGACLHANMDLYKWAHKLWPWVGSDLIAETFLLALEGRDMDMRASPYDLAELGYQPIRIETPEGREQYETEQRALAAKAKPVREKVLAAARRIGA
jgi:hypothetical protein